MTGDTMPEPKTECRTPAPGRDGITRIPTWKYDCVRAAILESIQSAGPDGVAFSDLSEVVRARLSPSQLEDLGSLGWHVTTVKLNMEVVGEIVRGPGSPQRLRLP
jgi:hypothetical protein